MCSSDLSTRMRIGTNGGYISSSRASDRIPLRDIYRMNFAINVIGPPRAGRILADVSAAA